LPAADLFVHVYVLVDDALLSASVPVPRRAGPPPACSDAAGRTIALVRHVLGRPSERAFLAEVRREWAGYFPRLPAQSEFNRRVRWLWGAFELLRQAVLRDVPEDPWQQLDTTALPVKHPSRVRGSDAWDGPSDLRAGFGFDAAHGEWFYGFRLGLRTDLGRRVIRRWGLVPAAVDERAVADALLDGDAPEGLLLDRGFLGRAWAAAQRRRGTTPGHTERRTLPRAVRRPVARLRNRIETTTGELTEGLGLTRHRAKTVWGLLTRAAATLLAHTLLRLALVCPINPHQAPQEARTARRRRARRQGPGRTPGTRLRRRPATAGP
jgi:hypothetical protein